MIILFTAASVACGSSEPTVDGDCANVTKGNTVPTRPGDLFTYLRCEGYAGLTAELAVHPSVSAHNSGRNVRTYINDALADSLRAQNAEHPVGAAAVKVFLEPDDTTPNGFAVMVKTEAMGRGGEGWYWYEVFSATSGARPIEGQGNPTCTGCHAQAMRDLVRTEASAFGL